MGKNKKYKGNGSWVNQPIQNSSTNVQNPEVLPMHKGQKRQRRTTEFLIIKKSTQELSLEQKDAITLSVEAEVKKQTDIKVEAEVKKQVAMDKNSLFTAFWLFSSVVTFISVEVQLLKSVCSWLTLAWLSFITLWWLGLFVILVDYIGRDRIEENNKEKNNKEEDNKEKKNKILMIILSFTCLVFFVGVWFVYQWNEQQCKENEIHQKFENEYWKKLIELENKIDHNKMFSEMYF